MIEKRGTLLVSAATCVVVTMIVGLCLYIDGYYLPYKPCRPVIYPSGQIVPKNDVYTTTDTVKTVEAFYDQHLNAEGLPRQQGIWVKESLDESMYLYSCHAIDINRTTTETGCIYIRPESDSTYIETKILISEGSNYACPRN